MNETVTVIVASLLGAALAGVYLGSLWLTVSRLPRARHPAVWMIASLLLRLAVLLVGVYYVARTGRWQPIVALLVAFFLVRAITLGVVRRRIAREQAAERVA